MGLTVTELTNVGINIARSTSEQVLTESEGVYCKEFRTITLTGGTIVGAGPQKGGTYVIMGWDENKHSVTFYDYVCTHSEADFGLFYGIFKKL